MSKLTRSELADLPVFDRKFWDRTFRFTRIGTGALGGKASRLVFMKDILADANANAYAGFDVSVPTMAVIGTDVFDEFIAQDNLAALNYAEISDARIANAFQHADLPPELVGDLRALISEVKTPLAIRSSSMLEDALERPFAGVYATKMIPNNELDADSRFRRLTEAIKLVYASTFFKEARAYLATMGCEPGQEKMAVIIQEVVGRRHGRRFYPDISGVARSLNFYPASGSHPQEGVVNLALGLGKTIVDGGVCWSFSPAQPKASPPFGSIRELMDETQTRFWAVNMGKPPAYDPVNEVECMVHADLTDAEEDEVLPTIASTYDAERDRIVPGTAVRGPRVLNFAPLLVYEQLPLVHVIKSVLNAAERALDTKVEIEFALTLDQERHSARLGFLQVRPLVVSDERVEISTAELSSPNAVVASNLVLGNGRDRSIRDVVFVRREHFSVLSTPAIAMEIERLNRALVETGRPYLLIGFGRWGSSHPSLGIPVDWSQISGARVIVEATLPQMNVELSQGSHFFHNLSSFRASYFMVRHDEKVGIDWQWLNSQQVLSETELVRHVSMAEPLVVRVDGRSARGVVLRGTHP